MFSFLITWYNLPFLIALGGCILFALLQVLGGIGDHHADTDLHAGADVDAELDLHTPTHLSHDHPDHDNDHAGLLAIMGIHGMPLALVLMSLLGCFGAVGLIGNMIAERLVGYTAIAFPIVLLVATLVAVVLTGRISRLLGRVVTEHSAVVGFEQLIGRVGVVTSATISATYGRVSLRDSYGTVHTVYAVLESDEQLPERSEVALVTYDHAQRRFIARSLR